MIWPVVRIIDYNSHMIGTIDILLIKMFTIFYCNLWLSYCVYTKILLTRGFLNNFTSWKEIGWKVQHICLKDETGPLSIVEQDLLTFREHLSSHPLFLMRFVWPKFYLSMLFFVDHCLYFLLSLPWLLYCLSFFKLRPLITHLDKLRCSVRVKSMPIW